MLRSVRGRRQGCQALVYRGDQPLDVARLHGQRECVHGQRVAQVITSFNQLVKQQRVPLAVATGKIAIAAWRMFGKIETEQRSRDHPTQGQFMPDCDLAESVGETLPQLFE